MIYRYVICHYSEIALKGKNRAFFERKLIENIKRSINSDFFSYIKKISGRILIELSDKGMAEREEISKSLNFVFGISSFLFCIKENQEIDNIGKSVLSILKKEKFETFKISSKRSDKNIPITSQELNEKIGFVVLSNIKKIKVDLHNPDIVCFIEMVQGSSFISCAKYFGPGGFPIGTGGRAISLLSGGIDSPVASYMAMRKGLKLSFIHFHSYPETSESSINKVRDLVKILSKYQGPSKLYLVPFSLVQKKIILNLSAKNRVIFYRRLMLKITEEVLNKERSLAIITGESLGQVASQTLENIKAINQSVNSLILRPLISKDKEMIIDKAKEIKTFNISILPHDDCCARFLPRRPETRAKTEEIIKEEKKINVVSIIKETLNEVSIEEIR